MKLKRLPDDFQVEEQISLVAGNGPFALYRLTKQSLGTLEALAAVARHWKLPREALAFAGLKDKHALTTQHITVRHGPRRGIAQTNFKLAYAGQVERPIHASDIAANRFLVVVRDLSQPEAAQARDAAQAAAAGLPNYFDNQRFGSVGESGEFIALPWCRGDYERALWLALADPNLHDNPHEREVKQFLREHWGDWPRSLEQLRDSHFSAVLAQLANQPADFRRAIARVPHELRSLWLAAFQSHLWNQVLSIAISENCSAERLDWRTIGWRRLPFLTDLSEAQRQPLRALSLPLPSARLHLADDALGPLYEKMLAAEGIELREIRVKYPRDSFFSKGDRPALFVPGEMNQDIADDELYAGRQKLTLQFTLPRGSYATILVKCLTKELSPELEADVE